MQLEALLKYKSLYKITGTPENFLTALRFMQWGFNHKNVDKWERIQPGDIVCFHSKIKDSKFIKSAPACVIGFGIVGSVKWIAEEPLWIEEFETGEIIYPYHFNFSEVFFFTTIEINNNWDSQTLEKRDATINLLTRILEAGIPLRELPGFNQNGSFSILHQVDSSILINRPAEFSVFTDDATDQDKFDPLTKINKAEESLRKATTLSIADEIQKKVINKKTALSIKDLTLLERAENKHFETLQHTLDYFKRKGYDTYSNKHVDLLAINETSSFLIEVKSLENNNFKSQMRKGIAQLFEYNYFEVQNFLKESSNLKLKNTNLLVTSKIPNQPEYIKFINSLRIEMAYRDNDEIIGIGTNRDFI